jgi:hypothetical protein
MEILELKNKITSKTMYGFNSRREGQQVKNK